MSTVGDRTIGVRSSRGGRQLFNHRRWKQSFLLCLEQAESERIANSKFKSTPVKTATFTSSQ